MRVTRRYRFVASHRLHSAALSEAENRELYGKCNNPFGHGHNYEVEITVRGPLDPVSARAVDPCALDALVTRLVLQPYDHRNLNAEVAAFATVAPTSENLGTEVYRRLAEGWTEAFPAGWPVLEKVRIAETANNIFEVNQFGVKHAAE